MKKTTYALLLIALFSFNACNKLTQTTSFTGNAPIYMSYEDLRTAVTNDNERALEHPGKIFLHNNWILINELEKGVHVYDNTNPSTPQHIAYIEIPGNIDMAVKNGMLYADSYVDLVAIDIRDPKNVREVGRAENVFSYTIPTLNLDDDYPVASIDQEKGVVIGYEVLDIVETCENAECFNHYSVEPRNEPFDGFGDEVQPTVFGDNANNVRSSATSPSSSIAGSMARFLMVDEHLYAISSLEEVKVFQLGSDAPVEIGSFRPWDDANRWGEIETLFRLNEHLFIGSNNGMLIYDVSNSNDPRYLSNYQHFTACDPVIANEEYAFVTLRGGALCGWEDINELQALDISDIMAPELITTLSMNGPYGLTMDNGAKFLFVCDGSSGLRTVDFRRLEQNELVELNQTSGFDAYDVILKDQRLHVIGNNGLLQFSYNESGMLQQISQLNLH